MMRIRSISLVWIGLLWHAAVAAAQTTPAPADPAAPESTPPAVTPAPETPPPAETPAPGRSAGALTVDPIAICKDVQNREPVDAAASFSSDVGVLHCFTKISGAEPPVTIYHRWYVGETMVLELPITVNGPTWRCWSRKTIQPSWSGACRVDVATEAGDVIATVPFTLESAPSASGVTSE